MTANPLLLDIDCPSFSEIQPDHVGPSVEAAINAHRHAMAAIIAAPAPDFASVFLAKERADAALIRGWSTVSHLKAVADTPELRAAHGAAQPQLIAYFSEVGQDRALYEAIAALLEREDTLTATERRAVELAVRGFRLSGVALPEPERSRFAAIQVELAALSTAFANAVMDATAHWTLAIEDEARLAGIPSAERAILAANARNAGQEGWLVTLHAPSIRAVLSFADDRDLRAQVYRAFNTRASDEGPDAGRFDNSDRITRIIALRREAATLLGFDTPVAWSLETKMAQDADEILAFLTDLAARARPSAEHELADLRAHAKMLGIDVLEPWDVGYITEKLRLARHEIDQSEVRRYFPLPRVLSGLFRLLRETFGVELCEETGIDIWHPDARYLSVRRDGVTVGGVYLDLYARGGKQGGAWMGVCRPRLQDGDRTRPPIAYLTCNFASPADGQPSLLTHDEVITLFHETGHCLHHVLTEIDLPLIGGIAGFEWDAVELPSQLMENFAWDRDVLTTLSGHVESGAPLPDALLDRMLAARNFQAATMLLRQIEFALFDLRFHLSTGTEPDLAGRILAEVRSEVALLQPPAWNRFAHAFSHIFAGGYAAGYYSYLWAERLSDDAFERFVTEGPTSPVVGRAFRDQILAVGASRPALESFIAFRGQAPRTDAMLKRRGLDWMD